MVLPRRAPREKIRGVLLVQGIGIKRVLMGSRKTGGTVVVFWVQAVRYGANELTIGRASVGLKCAPHPTPLPVPATTQLPNPVLIPHPIRPRFLQNTRPPNPHFSLHTTPQFIPLLVPLKSQVQHPQPCAQRCPLLNPRQKNPPDIHPQSLLPGQVYAQLIPPVTNRHVIPWLLGHRWLLKPFIRIRNAQRKLWISAGSRHFTLMTA